MVDTNGRSRGTVQSPLLFICALLLTNHYIHTCSNSCLLHLKHKGLSFLSTAMPQAAEIIIAPIKDTTIQCSSKLSVHPDPKSFLSWRFIYEAQNIYQKKIFQVCLKASLRSLCQCLNAILNHLLRITNLRGINFKGQWKKAIVRSNE